MFFDLVFVFAVTQISHSLLAHLTPLGLAQTVLVLLAVCWFWIYTTWTTNWLDPDRTPVRLMLLALMLGGLVLSSSIPEAFGERGLVFAVALSAMHLGRTLFVLYAFLRNGRREQQHNFVRIFAWQCAAAALWIAGGLATPELRMAWWAAAVALEYLAPLLFFWVPGLGRSPTSAWDVDGAHMAERCMLFVIIALGESLLVTGATFAESTWTASTVGAFLAAFVGTAAMWWVYFDTGAERASHRIAHSADPGRVARNAYTYLHLPIVAGIIVCAVADELVLAHPGHASDAGIAAIVGGPALYLAGTAAFKWTTNDRKLPPLSHLAGLLLLFALMPFAFAHVFSALAVGIATSTVMVMVAIWETLALRKPAR